MLETSHCNSFLIKDIPLSGQKSFSTLPEFMYLHTLTPLIFAHLDAQKLNGAQNSTTARLHD